MQGRNWVRLAVGLWAVLLGVTCIRPLFKPTSSTVFPIYAYAGEDFAAGKPLYSTMHAGADVYRYSPLVAAFFEPFTLLPLGVAGSLWRVIGAALFLTGLAAWARKLCPDVPLAGIFLFALPLSIGSLSNGQANVHILGMMLWATVLASRDWWAWAAVFIAAGALFKGYPIALGLLLALAAPIRHGLALGVALAVGVGLPFLLQDSSYVAAQYKEWLVFVEGDHRLTFPLFAGYQDFHMLLRVFGLSIGMTEYRMLQVGTGAALAGVIAGQLWKGVPRDRVAMNAGSLGLAWMATFGPCVESSTFILIAPVAAREMLDRVGRPRWAGLCAWIGGLMFLGVVILFAFPHPIHRPVIALGVQPIAALLIALAVLGRILATRVPAVETPTISEPLRLAA
jgi:hypothetical protein